MTATQETIIACLKMNITNAKTKGMRDFATEQYEGFLARVRRSEKPKPTPPRAFTAFLDKL